MHKDHNEKYQKSAVTFRWYVVILSDLKKPKYLAIKNFILKWKSNCTLGICSLIYIHGILQTNIRRGSGRCFLLDFDKKQQENQFSSCDYPC